MKLLSVLLIAALTACALPQTQPHVDAKQEPKLAPKTFIAEDDAKLPIRSWMPKGKPRAVIVALHGFNDYSHAFQIPGEYMRLRGIATFAYDQRGFGGAPKPGYWAGENNLTRDVASIIKVLKKTYPKTPIFLLGESMGGAVAVSAAAEPDFPPIDGVILSAPALWGGDTMNPLFRVTLWMFAHMVPGKVLTGEDLHILASDNIEMLRALGGDPLVLKGTRTDAIYGLVQLMDDAYENIGHVKAPILLLYGAKDQVIPPDPILNGLSKAPVGTRAAYYPLGYHMLLRDLHGDVPVQDIIAWTADPKAPLPSGADEGAKDFLKKQKPKSEPRKPFR